MERFHRNLVVDYANRPYIRWLLSHWMGGGSAVAVTKKDLKLAARKPVAGKLNRVWAITPNSIFDRALYIDHAIEPRFMASSKHSYLALEFRMVGMVENARQLRAAALLIDTWIAKILSRTGRIRFTLTIPQWNAMTKEKTARKICAEWVDNLGLDWATYETAFFDRNYLLRIKHGEFV